MDIKVQVANELNESDISYIDGFNEDNAKEFSKILKRFISSYCQKDEKISIEEWLIKELKTELPELTDDETIKLSKECIQEINDFDNNLKSLNETINRGGTKEGWFSQKVQEASIGVSVNEYGNYLNTINQSINNANTQMLRVITNKNGSINQNMNLDGFMAEQHHVNSFNMNAKLNGSNYYAEVLVPQVGQTYGKNSFDAVIRDGNGKIIHQYQMKYGAEAEDTIKLIHNGNYNNQQIVVPPEQLEKVKAAFPGKSIISSIGGTDKIKVTSQPLSKDQAKEMQLNIQNNGEMHKIEWNHFKTKELTIHLAKNAGKIGIQAAAITTGFNLAQKVLIGERIEVDETIEIALTSGADAGIKAAAAGAVKVGIEKGVISIIPKGTPIGILTNIVCLGIENVKILSKVATGELTLTEALTHMGRITTAMVYGVGWGSAGALIGAAALSWIPIAGPMIGGFVGGIVGYMAGSRFGETIYNTGKKVCNTAKNLIKTGCKKVKSGFNKAKNFLFG